MNNVPGFDWVNSIQAKLNSGISTEQCLEIKYQSFTSSQENKFKVSPYYLKQYNYTAVGIISEVNLSTVVNSTFELHIFLFLQLV